MRIVCQQTILMKNHSLFFRKFEKMSQNLSSAAVVIGALRVIMDNCFFVATVLDDNEQAAKILAEMVHTDVNICDTSATEHLDQNLNIDNLGVWIDPIGKLSSHFAPNFEKVEGAYCFWLVCPSFYPSVLPSVRYNFKIWF